MKTLRDLGFGRDVMETRILDEIDHLFDVIDKSQDEPIHVRKVLAPSVSNNVAGLVFGHRFDYDHPRRLFLDDLLDPSKKNTFLIILMIIFSNVPKLFKILAYFGLLGTRETREMSYQMIKMVSDEIDEHEKSLDTLNVRDYIDGFLIEMKKQQDDGKSSFTRDMLSGNVRGFFAAGSDTVRTTLEWIFLTLSVYPEVQDQLRTEIDTQIGERSPTWADRNRMPFTQAVLAEVQRWKTVVPLNLPRRTLEDIVVQGVKIPKNTQLLANFYSVHHDPKIWGDDESEFKPERFLDQNGQFVKRDEFIAFSYGKRACPGESLAIVELFLYVTKIIQRYKLELPFGVKPDFSETIGLTSQPKTPVVLNFKLLSKN